jgi:hypothetical protein
MKELFVGYLPQMPPGIANFVRQAVMALLLGVGLLAIALVGSQDQFPSAGFEYGTIRDFEGVVEERPYPALIVTRPGVQDAGYPFSRYVLVGVGKHGADAEVSGLAGKKVKLQGKLIYRGSQTLVEVMLQSVQVVSSGTPVAVSNVGMMTLTGEIVDSKCYFGVMNPGQGKVHRECAARCLSGGIPPAFIVRDANRGSVVYLLANADGGRVPSQWAADHAAQRMTISGRVAKSGDTLILNADLNSLRAAK